MCGVGSYPKVTMVCQNSYISVILNYKNKNKITVHLSEIMCSTMA